MQTLTDKVDIISTIYTNQMTQLGPWSMVQELRLVSDVITLQ